MPDCDATLILDPERQAAIPDGAYLAEDSYCCGLSAGHPGDHMTCLQNDDDVADGRELWACWSVDGPAEWVRVDMCESTQDEERGAVCLRPAGHWGMHTDGGDEW